MQKQHKDWKKVEYAGAEKTAPSVEASHLEHVHAGEMSHEHTTEPKHEMLEHKKMHKHHKVHHKMATELVVPTEPTSAFSWHLQDGLLGDGVGVSVRVRAKAQEVSQGFG